MKFDWYAATIQDHPRNIVEGLAANMRADEVKEMKGGRHGYTGGFEIIRGGGIVASVLAGGRNPHPSAKASGSETPDFVGVVRGLYGNEHHVSRMDSCTDFDEPGVWDKLSGIIGAIADEHGLTVTRMESRGKEGNLGRTMYVGAPSSAARVRFYEKGFEMAGKFPHEASTYSRDWVRLEAQIRPQKEARSVLAKVSAAEAWGASRTTRFILERCKSVSVERIAGPRHDLADDVRSLFWMAGQYAKPLARHRQKFPDGEGFSRDIFRMVDRTVEERDKSFEKILG